VIANFSKVSPPLHRLRTTTILLTDEKFASSEGKGRRSAAANFSKGTPLLHRLHETTVLLTCEKFASSTKKKEERKKEGEVLQRISQKSAV